MADTVDLSALAVEPQQGVPVWPEAAGGWAVDRCPVFYPTMYPICGLCQSPEGASLLPVDPMSGAHTDGQNPIHANMMTKTTPQLHNTTIADWKLT